VKLQQLQLLRAHFYWGKNRINDHRPTIGVSSEAIHSLDLIQHVSLIQITTYIMSQVVVQIFLFSVLLLLTL
jgi:hypothetical protein